MPRKSRGRKAGVGIGATTALARRCTLAQAGAVPFVFRVGHKRHADTVVCVAAGVCPRADEPSSRNLGTIDVCPLKRAQVAKLQSLPGRCRLIEQRLYLHLLPTGYAIPWPALQPVAHVEQ